MESKQALFGILAKSGRDRRRYFEELFKYVPEAAVQEISYGEIRKDEILLSAGERSDTVFFLLRGEVIGLDYQKIGRMYSFMDFTKMNILGDFEAFGGILEYGVTIRAAENCRFLKMPVKSYLNWIKHDENALFLRLSKIVTALMSERRLDREYISMNCKERLMRYLVKSYEKHGSVSGSYTVKKTQAELADKVGFNVRSVQRSIAALQKEGFITVKAGKITVSREQHLKLEKFIEIEEKEMSQNGKI